MSLESEIQTALSGVTAATGGVWQDLADQGTIAPYIVWMQVI